MSGLLTNEILVSVILPFHNNQGTLQSTLDSLIAQSEQRYELIAVNDASTDQSRSIVTASAHKFYRFKLIDLPFNQGPGRARNAGIAAASANLIALIDADDVWFSNKLSVQLAIHQALKCAFTCTAFRVGKAEVFQDRTDYKSLLKNNVINTSTVMFDKSQLNIKFKSEYKSEDYIAWLQVAKQAKIQFINVLLAERKAGNGLSADKLAMARKRWAIYQDEKLSLLAALYYMGHYIATGLIKYRAIKGRFF